MPPDKTAGEGTSLSESDLGRLLQTRILGRGLIEIHTRINSTNQRARELGLTNAPEGTLVLAETQTAGRGRLGRNWHSPPGLNLYFSLILRPNLPPDRTTLLTLAAGVGAAEAVSRVTGRKPSIKWPNDLLMGQRKVAGILSEMETRGANLPFVILGLGLNVNLKPADLPAELLDLAGSLFMATGRDWDRTALLAAMLKEIENQYEALKAGRAGDVLEQYRQACQTIGSQVRIAQGESVIQGTAVAVNESGELVIRPAGGRQLVCVNAGEVTLIKPPPETGLK
ncbi:MAG: biotin--[acetyl-CoA-carboxylase] ligase [Thermodesulfobacteriota bacterium]|nr:biotin--[acetyl-CoA-carboxylase] ligase [Thermodesulfobacteriota bacterium]